MGSESGREVVVKLKGLVEKWKLKVVSIGSSIKKTAKDDPRRLTHSFKVGVALTLVSFLYYWRPLYDGFGVAAMWAVLTVVVVFEFTVGGTLSKSLNRGFATLTAGALGFVSQHLATVFGERGEPFILALLVFILAGGCTFSRFFPKIKARYDYGVVIFILTFSLVAVSGYRTDKLLELAHQRLSTIIIGGATCILISLFVSPVWAGQDLHNLLASNILNLANYLQGLEGEYFQCPASDQKGKPEKSKHEGYKSVLNSKATEESLANLARWEPGHGRFGLRHPWKQYLKIGALARECAFKMEALNAYLITSEIQVSLEFKRKVVQESCRKMSCESSKALKALSSSIKTMREPSYEAQAHLQNAQIAIKDLKIALQTASLQHTHTNLLAILPLATAASILVEITKTVHKIYEAVSELSHLAHFKPNVSPEKPHLLHRGIITPLVDAHHHNHIEITILDSNTDSPDKGIIQNTKIQHITNGGSSCK